MFRTCFIYSFSLIILLLPIKISYAQEKSEIKDWFVEAESYFLFEEYKDALPLYQKILRVEPDNYNVMYKIGICYLNDTYQKGKSILYLEKAADHINYNYRINSYREKLAPPEALYYLGKAYHVNNKFDEAIESYRRFLSTADPVQFDFEVVNEDIDASQMAKKIYNDPVFFSAKDLGSTINSRFEDINPVLSGDGKILAFTRRLQFYDAAFYSVKGDDGKWSEPINLTEDFGLDGNSYTTGISYFGDEIYVYRSDEFDGNIYASKRISNKWSRLEKLNSNINTKFWESHAAPTPDGQYLIFTSNRDGGYGGLDIYKSKRTTSGLWGVAVNLGPVVNSPFNEETPFISNEGKTIFFSSEGHNTIGGYDVFISNLQNDGTWSRPVNMGYPVNTSDDDLFYYPTGINNFALVSLFLPSNTQGLRDIYEVEVYNQMIPRTFTLSGNLNVENASGKVFKKISAKLIDKSSNQVVSESAVTDDGSYTLQAREGNYLLVIEGPEIETYKKDISLQALQPETIVAVSDISLIHTEIPPVPVEVAAAPVKSPIVVKNSFFSVTDSSRIPIELTLPKGSDLKVIVKVDNTITSTEEIENVKRRFTYFYKPQPGENILNFTATDADGQESSTEVIIVYNPVEMVQPTQIAKVESQEKPLDSELFSVITSGKLKDYLIEIDLNEFESYFDLYTHLIQVASEIGFTEEEINQLFSVFFSQSDSKGFYNDFEAAMATEDSIRIWLADSINIPLAYLNTLLDIKNLTPGEMKEALLKIHASENITPSRFYKELADFFSTEDSLKMPEKTLTSLEEAWEIISSQTSNESALKALMLYSTTNDLQFFYQNLLLNSEGGLHTYLTELRMEQEGINTSIDLVEHLFKNANGEYYTKEELIKALELARVNRQYYLEKFIEMLSIQGEGALKSQLILLSKNKGQIESFEDLFGYLLNQSKYKNYSLESVYSLFLDLIGIDNVEEFAAKLESYGYTAINKALRDTTISSFSNPLELIKYLLAATRMYDFTEADINNLLIRMMLERGLDFRSIRSIDEIQGKFWKSRKFLTTFILVNIVLLILILLFWLRRKK